MLSTPEVLVASPSESTQISLLLDDLNLSYQLESSGADVLAHLRGNTPELIIMSARLPEITGTSIAYRIKKIKRLVHVPILLIVDGNDAKMRAEAELSGVNHVLLTPFRITAVERILKHLLTPPLLLPDYPSSDHPFAN